VIVVDASALSAFILKEPGWRALSEYLMNSISIDHVTKEVANAIWKAYIGRVIGAEQARRLYSLMKSMIGVNVVLEPEEKYLDRTLEIALEHKVTIYDALYIALARESNIPLLTLDEKQAQVARKLNITVLPR